MLNSMRLATISEMKITEIDRALLIDINNVKIDTSLPAAQRMESFITQIGNPYCFLSGDTPVRVRFVSQKKTLARSLGDYFSSLK